MERQEILEVLEQTGAVRRGHFKLTSGRHSDTYIQCARIQEYPTINNRLAEEAVKALPQEMEIDLVAAPAVGGIVFGYAVAAALEKRFIWSERVDGSMQLRRSFEVGEGEKVLICEDVVTTGGSVQDLIDLIEENGGVIVGVVSMIDRGGDRKFDDPYYPLIQLPTPSWEAEECALCKDGVELYSPGSRHIKK
ncbi:MAG: orotate phosphoribosyltransferase [Raoultibacter sp.]